MDYEALRRAVEKIQGQSDAIGVRLATKFDERQDVYESEKRQSKPSGEQMNVAFNL